MPKNDSFNIQFNIALPNKILINSKKKSADPIQKKNQFNSQGILDTDRIGNVHKNCPKCPT